jgi:hypothetical protein
MTAAVAHGLLKGREYAGVMREFARCHPFAGYGGNFDG